MKFIFAATTHPIVSDPRYSDYSKTFLTPNDLKSDKGLVEAEIDRIKNIIPTTQTTIRDENGISIDKALFLQKIKNSLRLIEQQEAFSDVTQSELFAGTGLTGTYKIDEIPEQIDAENKRELAALEKLIRERQENIAEIDAWVLRTLLGKPFQPFTASGKSKFIKIADDMDKEADKVIEEYYDDLYEESEGSPNYGKVLNNPEKYHHTLTTDASTTPKPSKFKKI